jgi:hypothetical protein
MVNEYSLPIGTEMVRHLLHSAAVSTVTMALQLSGIPPMNTTCPLDNSGANNRDNSRQRITCE